MVKESSNFTIFGAEINGGLASMDSTESHWVFQDKDDSEIEDDYDEDDPSQRTANTAKENCSSEQATIEENCNSNLNSAIQRCDNRMVFARQGSVSQANFMRQATTEEINPAESDLPLKPSGYKGSYNDSEAPLF